MPFIIIHFKIVSIFWIIVLLFVANDGVALLCCGYVIIMITQDIHNIMIIMLVVMTSLYSNIS